eukprot:6090672-Alexandrium_andersonii.AAC.1
MALRSAQCGDRGPPPEHVATTLQCFEAQRLLVHSVRYPWSSALAKHRSLFSTCLFAFGDGDRGEAYLFVYALQNPALCCFARAVRQ